MPVAIWQGTEDLMVPFAHGLWLADHVAGVDAHLLEQGGRPLHVANAILFLLSDLAAFITGVDLPVDGGYLIDGQPTTDPTIATPPPGTNAA